MGFGNACTDPVEASPARGQSSVGNVGGAGSREPLQGLDGVYRRVSRGSARSLAHGAVRVPQTGCGDVGDGAICSAVVHTRLFDGAKVVFFCSNPERDGGPASSQTRRCSLEIPLDAARCRCSVHWREGGSARRCASRNGVPQTRGLIVNMLFSELDKITYFQSFPINHPLFQDRLFDHL